MAASTAVATGMMNLRRMLPAGTLMIFQMLTPLLTNNGRCHRPEKAATGVLLLFCALSCAFSTFTDLISTGDGGKPSYGVATMKGMFLLGDYGGGSNRNGHDLSSYRLRPGDFVHAFISVIVFATLALLDPNTSSCYYPPVRNKQKVLNMAPPPVIGAIASVVFLLFPNKRHNIGSSDAPSSLIQTVSTGIS